MSGIGSQNAYSPINDQDKFNAPIRDSPAKRSRLKSVADKRAARFRWTQSP